VKLHKETWEIRNEGTVSGDGFSATFHDTLDDMPDVGDVSAADYGRQLKKHEAAQRACEARARLASAAPDMARVLLSLCTHGCPECGGWLDEVRGTLQRHRDTCRLAAALRKAGVL
jgi:glycine/D-amino acid oxidase-like deaminating enzyme